MPVRETSLIALEKLKRLEPDQQAIIVLLDEIGPAHDRRILEALNQKEQATLKPKRLKRIWEINQVTARRNELVRPGLVRDLGRFAGYWKGQKKIYHFWSIWGDLREPIGWKRLPDKPALLKTDDKCLHCPYRLKVLHQQAVEKAEKPILKKLQDKTGQRFFGFG